MSWGFRDFDSITRRGHDLFSVLDASSPEGIRPHELHDDYELAKDLALPDHVPASLRDYLDGTRMLWLHGWFYYPFYSMAAVHSYLCMELALKERIQRDSILLPRKQRNFAGMLAFAIENNWFYPHGFARIRRQIEYESQLLTDDSDDQTGANQFDGNSEKWHAWMVRLLEGIRLFRNAAAHPDGLKLLLPNLTYAQIEFTRDAIVQLFPGMTLRPGEAG